MHDRSASDSDSASVAIFAPRPISTVLWGASAVEIFPYEPGVGIAASPSRTAAFAGIDLDLWFRSIAAQLDALLTAELTAAVEKVDRAAGSSRLGAVREQRGRIATALSALMVPAHGASRDTADVVSAVAQVFRGRLLVAFGELYETQALLALGPTTMALVAGPETVRDASGAVVASNRYDFGDTAVDVPLVLRRYPDPPSAVVQSASADAAGARDAIAAAKRWRYRCTYVLPFHDPRDVVMGHVRFNADLAPADGALRAAFDGDGNGDGDAARDVFAGLAQFVVVFPDVAVDVRRALRGVTGSTEPDAATVRDAGVALDALVALLRRIDVPPAAAPVLAQTTLRAGDVEFTLAERAASDGRLVVTLALQHAGALPLDAFTVQAGDGAEYLPEALASNDGGGKAQRTFVYVRAGSEPAEYLSAADGQTIAERTVEIAGLDALARPNARAAFAVQRNGGLAPAFVYRTAAVWFEAPCAPYADFEPPIVLDAARRPIRAHLSAFFAELLDGAAMKTLATGASIAYAYDLANASGLPPIVVPVVLQPPQALVVRGAGAQAALDDLLASWQDAVVTWFAATVPQPGGTLRFDLTFANATAPEPVPLLRIRDVQIPLAAIEPPLNVAER